MTTQHERVRLLVIDDDVAVREMMVEYLSTRGYSVDGTSDGRVALELLRSTVYDVVLTDYQVPHVDGLGVLRVARQLNPPLPTILMTGYGTVETAVSALKEGAADFLLKPFRLRRMHEAIVQALERGRQARADTRLASLVALYDFAASARSRWHLRPLYQQIATRALAERDCAIGAVLAESPETGAWEIFTATSPQPAAEPDLLAALDVSVLRTALARDGALRSDDAAPYFPGVEDRSALPSWLAARAFEVELPGAAPRMAGALLFAGQEGPAPRDDGGLQAMLRYCALAGMVLGRVLTLDPPPRAAGSTSQGA